MFCLKEYSFLRVSVNQWKLLRMGRFGHAVLGVFSANQHPACLSERGTGPIMIFDLSGSTAVTSGTRASFW